LRRPAANIARSHPGHACTGSLVRSLARRRTIVAILIVALLPAVAAAASMPAMGQELSVAIRSPIDDELVAGRVEMRAEVEGDGADEILFVEFEVDGRILFADASPPYELIWHAGEPSAHDIVARAYTPAGRIVEDRVSTRPALALAGETFATRVERVTVFVRLEGRDAPHAELRPEDFVVLEDERPQPVLSVERVEELPLAVGFMVDASGSMVARLGLALDSAASFIDGMVQLPQDKAFVMSFADLPSMLQAFTNDVDRLAGSLELISRGRYTKLFDSLVAATDQFEGHAGRRALVLLTDGHDAGSDARLDDAVRAAQQADVAIYPVAVNLGSQYFHERWVLERLARSTGGRVSDLHRLDDPTRIYAGIAADLRAQYRIAYRPVRAGGSGEWREIQVRLADAERYRRTRIRTRPGYFAE
jgi:VWFA-related protein